MNRRDRRTEAEREAKFESELARARAARRRYLKWEDDYYKDVALSLTLTEEEYLATYTNL